MHRAALPIALVVALVAVPMTVSADFHPVCEPPPAAYANVELHAYPLGYDTVLVYSGAVYCPGTVVTIEELELLDDPLDGPAVQVTNDTGEPCDAGTTTPCIVSDTAPNAAGTYRVRMIFDVDDPATPELDFDNVTRVGRYVYTGQGQPVPICVHVGALPIAAGLC